MTFSVPETVIVVPSGETRVVPPLGVRSLEAPLCLLARPEGPGGVMSRRLGEVERPSAGVPGVEIGVRSPRLSYILGFDPRILVANSSASSRRGAVGEAYEYTGDKS